MSNLIQVPNSWQSEHPGVNLGSLNEYKRLYDESINDPCKFYGEQARELLSWLTPFTSTKYPQKEEDGFHKSATWFLDGELNACYNCVDRHALKDPHKTAIIFESDDGSKSKKVSYGELLEQVCQLSQLLESHGVQKGDTVAVYLPMIPEAIVAIMAIVRLGAIHSVVFAGFSSNALRDRILDARSKVVITTDQSCRGGRIIPTKQIVDEAVAQTPEVHTVIVVRRTGADISMKDKRDIWYHEEAPKFKPYCPPTPVSSEDVLYLLYTSGSTGKPKGLIHTTAGYLLHAALTAKYVFDVRPSDTVFTGADIGWVAGHTYVCYAPLVLGATTIVYEGTPVHPHPGRFWEIVDRHQANIFYIAPTALRLLKREGDAVVSKYSLKSLKSLGVVGEPCAPEVWEWYYRVVGRERCTVQDTFWQTETGGPMLSLLAGVTPMKAGSVAFPFLGVRPAILDPLSGHVLEGNGVEGVLAFAQSWPGLARGVWGDYQRYLDTYFKPYPGYFFTGDGAARDEDGYYWIKGRVDDVVNVSGHRLSTAEIEAAILEDSLVSENAVVGYNHDVLGQAIASFVSLASNDTPKEAVVSHLRERVRQEIGPFATPKAIFVVDDLPKTRSGKIMRRILRKILNGEADQLGDISTLSNPGAVENVKRVVEGGDHLK